MKRNPRKVAWTKAFRAARGKDMVSDTTLEFAKKRNRPIKYDRDIWNSTMRAMKRIEEIKIRRQEDFYRARMSGNKKKEFVEAKREIARDKDMVISVVAQKRMAESASSSMAEKAVPAASQSLADILASSEDAKLWAKSSSSTSTSSSQSSSSRNINTSKSSSRNSTSRVAMKSKPSKQQSNRRQSAAASSSQMDTD